MKCLALLALFLPSLAYAGNPMAGPLAGGGGGASVDDTAYGETWNGDTTTAPSKNAVYDKIETLAGGHDAVTLDANADSILSLSTQELGLDTEAANTVLAGPASGADAVPTFRALDADDIPDISATYQAVADMGTDVPSNEADPVVGAVSGVVCADGAGNVAACSNLEDTAYGTGDVTAPASPTDGVPVCWDGTDGTTKDCATLGLAQDESQAGYVRLYELSGGGSNYVGFLSPDARDTSLDLLLPTADPAGQSLSCGTPSGTTSTCTWITPITTTGGTAASGAYDLGSADSLEVPNGANPTVDAAGEIAVDSSAGAGSGIRFYGNASPGAVTFPAYQTKCTTIAAADSDSDYMVESLPYAVTIRAVRVVQRGATNVVGHMDECDSAGASCAGVDGATDITATSTQATDDGTLSNPSIDANDVVQWHTTSVSGTNTDLLICMDYTVDVVN